MRLPYLDMGQIAAELLFKQIAGEWCPTDSAEETLVRMPLVERSSVADLG